MKDSAFLAERLQHDHNSPTDIGEAAMREAEALQLDPHLVTVGEFIDASAGTGKVSYGEYDGATVAVKSIPLRNERHLREIVVCHGLSHPNIAVVYGWYESNNVLHIVMPLYKDGSVQRALKNARESYQQSVAKPQAGGVLGWSRFFAITLGVLRALRYMASRQPHPVVHRDLKPDNVLMDGDTVVLSDFGIATLIDRTCNSICGTNSYSSLEQLKGEKQEPPTDIFAFGVMAWEMLHYPRRPRGHLNNDVSALHQELTASTPLSMEEVPEALHVLSACFDARPEKRPRADDLIVAFEAARSTLTRM